MQIQLVSWNIRSRALQSLHVWKMAKLAEVPTILAIKQPSFSSMTCRDRDFNLCFILSIKYHCVSILFLTSITSVCICRISYENFKFKSQNRLIRKVEVQPILEYRQFRRTCVSTLIKIRLTDFKMLQSVNFIILLQSTL